MMFMTQTRNTAITVIASGILLTAGASTGTAETVSDRIAEMSRETRFEAIKTSPDEGIANRVKAIRLRGSERAESFAEPELDIEKFVREDPSRALMNPDVLDALARMPRDQAADVLRMIEDRRSGLDPLSDIPSLSMSGKTPESPEKNDPESLSLEGWNLMRDASGTPFVQFREDAVSRIEISKNMVLGDLGRVKDVVDSADTFEVRLETGDVISGTPRGSGPRGSEQISREDESLPETDTKPSRQDKDPGNTSPRASPGSRLAVSVSLRPRARPQDLQSGGQEEVVGTVSAVRTSPRPVARPSRPDKPAVEAAVAAAMKAAVTENMNAAEIRNQVTEDME